jgi:hypothetical protein
MRIAQEMKMSTYEMDDGTIVKTENATASWKEDKNWDGRNYISVATGSQWDHEMLYRSKKGRYYIESTSQWQGRTDTVRWVSNRQAAIWLIANDHELPEELEPLRDEVEE